MGEWEDLVDWSDFYDREEFNYPGTRSRRFVFLTNPEKIFYNLLGVLTYMNIAHKVERGYWHNDKPLHSLELPHLANLYNKLGRLEQKAKKVYDSKSRSEQQTKFYGKFQNSFAKMKSVIAQTIRAKREKA